MLGFTTIAGNPFAGATFVPVVGGGASTAFDYRRYCFNNARRG